MHQRLLVIFLLLLAGRALASDTATRVPIMAADQVRPGAVGIGRTVFRGTRIDTFGVQVVDVMKNVFGPRQDLILARLSGGPLPLEKTGVVAGMSGSPVYIEGKLIGAVAFAWGFAKEPICGITPILEMVEAMNRVSEDRPPSPGRGHREVPHVVRPGLTGDLGAEEAMKPVAVPLVASGFAPEALEQLRSDLKPFGLFPVQGGGGTDTTLSAGVFEPGAAVGVQLVRGDLSLTGIGTLTYRDGDRVVAFGHPMFSGGRSSLPMTSAHIYGVVSSQLTSFKLGAAGAVQGAIVEDRDPGIVGLLGQSASTISVAVTIASGMRSREFHFEVVRHPELTPILTRQSLFSALVTAEKQSGEVTARTRTILRVEGYPDLRVENIYSGPQAFGLTVLGLTEPLDALLNNPFQSAPVRDVRFEVAMDESLHTASVVEILTRSGRFRPGDPVPFQVLLRPFHGPERTITGEVTLPSHVLRGPLVLWAGGGSSAEKMEAKRAPGRFVPRSFQHLLELLRGDERNDDLVVELISQDRGVTMDGAELLSPPSSVLSILKMTRQAGALDRTDGSVVARTRIRTDFFLSGQQQAPVTVEQE